MRGGVGPAVVWWWSGGVVLQALLFWWVVRHFGVTGENFGKKSSSDRQVIVSLMEMISPPVREEKCRCWEGSHLL